MMTITSQSRIHVILCVSKVDPLILNRLSDAGGSEGSIWEEDVYASNNRTIHTNEWHADFQDDDNDHSEYEDTGNEREYTDETEEEADLEHGHADNSSMSSDQSYQYGGPRSPRSTEVGILLIVTNYDSLTFVQGHER
jgi:hypothetical protein